MAFPSWGPLFLRMFLGSVSGPWLCGLFDDSRTRPKLHTIRFEASGFDRLVEILPSPDEAIAAVID